MYRAEVKERYTGSPTLREFYLRLKKVGYSEPPSEMQAHKSGAAAEGRESTFVNEELAVSGP